MMVMMSPYVRSCLCGTFVSVTNRTQQDRNEKKNMKKMKSNSVSLLPSLHSIT